MTTLAMCKELSQSQIKQAVLEAKEAIEQYNGGLMTADELSGKFYTSASNINQALINFAGMAIYS